MDEYTPSPWMVSQFGTSASAVAAGLPSAGRAAQERAMDAKIGSGLRTNEAYGASFWVVLPEEVATELAGLPGAETVRPTGSRYDLVVVNGTLVLPMKAMPNSTGPDRLRIRLSDLKRSAFALRPRESVEQTLDFGEFDGAVAGLQRSTGSFGSAARVVPVIYECAAEAGVEHIYIGEGLPLEDGTMVWSHYEELAPAASLTNTLAAARTTAPTVRFDDAPLPATGLALLTDVQAESTGTVTRAGG